MEVRIVAIVATALALGTAGCGDDTTTVINQTTVTEAARPTTDTTSSPSTVDENGSTTCGPVSGGLHDLITEIATSGAACPEAHAVIEGWVENSCGGENIETRCNIYGGYNCEGARIGTDDRFAVACSSASERVTFTVAFDSGA